MQTSYNNLSDAVFGNRMATSACCGFLWLLQNALCIRNDSGMDALSVNSNNGQDADNVAALAGLISDQLQGAVWGLEEQERVILARERMKEQGPAQ